MNRTAWAMDQERKALLKQLEAAQSGIIAFRTQAANLGKKNAQLGELLTEVKALLEPRGWLNRPSAADVKRARRLLDAAVKK